MFDSFEHKFLLVGHSFSTADRNFALIEKRWKNVPAETMDDVKNCIVSVRHQRPFHVLEMDGKFIDFDKAAESLINTKNIKISNVCQIRVDNDKPGVVKTKKSFSNIETWEEHKVFRSGTTMDTIKSVTFTSPEEGKMSDAKKADIRKMLPYISEQNRAFFEDILS